MEILEQGIELIDAAASPEEAFEQFCATVGDYGFNKVTYSLLTDHPSLGLLRQHGLATSYPESWMKYYQEHGYMAIDPVVQRCMTSNKPFYWSDLVADPRLPEPSRRLMREAEEAGLRDGIAIPLRGLPGEIVGVGFARDHQSGEHDYGMLSKLYLLSVYFHETFRSMLQPAVNKKITDREREVLSWAAEGKTDDEISMILDISANTVRFHWKNIFKKLDANGRIYAVAKAIRLQLIMPGIGR